MLDRKQEEKYEGRDASSLPFLSGHYHAGYRNPVYCVDLTYQFSVITLLSVVTSCLTEFELKNKGLSAIHRAKTPRGWAKVNVDPLSILKYKQCVNVETIEA
jgi:hypothetical protein